MQLLQPITFSSAVASARDDLIEISKLVGEYLKGDSANEFMAACDNLDYNKANELLDKTVEKMTGETSFLFAISNFLSKIAKSLTGALNGLAEKTRAAFSESDKVKVIASHYDELMKIVDNSLK